MEIMHVWSLDDLYDAHAVLDAYDELARLEAEAARAHDPG